MDNDIKNEAPDDFISMVIDGVYKFDWWLLLAVAISYIFVVSSLYTENVVRKFKHTTINGDLTTYGYIIQLLSLLIGTIIIRLLIATT